MPDNQIEKQGNRSLELCKRVVTTESFIAEAKDIYGDRYDYSKVDYKNREHRVIVTCPVHGDFQVYAREHLDGKGCPKCEKGEKFLTKLKEKFGEKFGLEKFVYESSTIPVTLICPIHGEFSKLPHGILNSRFGCPECGNEVQRQQQEESHKAAIAKKEEIKRIKEEQEAQWLREWEAERTAQKVKREKAMKAFRAGKTTSQGFHSSFQVYQQNVDEHIDDIRYNAKWREPYRAPYRLTNQEARKLSIYGDGYEYYRYIGEAPDDFVMQSFKNDCPYAGWIGDWLSHRSCKIFFEGNDLIIQVESEVPKQESYDTSHSEKFSIRSYTAERSTTKHLPTDFVSIDFETLYSQRVSACSIGMVKYRDGKKIGQYYSLIRPPFDYPGKSGKVLTWVHGISEDDVKEEKTFTELLPDIEAFVDGLPLVAHNASVEKCCIRDVCAYYEINTKLNYENILDTLPLSREAEAKLGLQVEGQGTHSLDVVCSRFDVPMLNHHNALEDAEMCGNLMVKFREILTEGKSIEMKVNDKLQAKSTEQNKVEIPSNNQVDQEQVVTEQNSKGGCLGIVGIGIILMTLVTLL